MTGDLFLRSFLKKRYKTYKIAITNIKAKGARSIETNAINKELPVSIVETIGLASPPLATVDVRRNEAALPLIAAAVPPPAIIAKAQVAIGFKSPTVAKTTAVPAIPARGRAMESNILSTQGM